MLESRWRTGLLSLVALLLVAGCGKQAPVPEPEPEPEPEPAPEIVVGSPGPVGDMTAVATCEDGTPTITLGWAEVDKADSYVLERDYAVIREFDEPATVTYVDSDVQPGTDYTYRLTALNEYGEASSAPATVDLAYDICVTVSGVRLAAARSSSFAISDDGSLWAWGDNDFGQLGTGITNDAQGVQAARDLRGVISVAPGLVHTLVLDVDGTVWGFGQGSLGQLGSGSIFPISPVGVPISGLPKIKAVAAGSLHSLALAEDGTVWGWGRNLDDELGLGDDAADTIDVPTQIDGLSNVVSIHAGGAASFAIHEDGTVSAWGLNSYGQLGLGDEIGRSVPETIPGLTGITKVSVGAEFTLMLDDAGSVWAMGYGDLMANGTLAHESSPRKLESLAGIVDIAAGYRHVLALRDDGRVVGWGYNDEFQLADLEDGFVPGPLELGGLEDVVRIAAGESHSLALTSAGRILSWGLNTSFQLGPEDVVERVRFGPVDMPGEIMQVAAAEHALALLDDGTVWAWGIGHEGELGIGEQQWAVGSPVQVEFPDGISIVKVGAAEGFSMALDSEGALWSWGYGGSGQLGHGDTDYLLEPKRIDFDPAVVFTDFAVGEDHVLAVSTGDIHWAWGRNSSNQLGIGDTDDRSVPTRDAATAPAGVKGVAAGFWHSALVLDDGTVWTFGNNSYGQLGIGSTNASGGIPVQSDQTGASAVVAGRHFSIALLEDGTLSAWGNNAYGQLGLGFTSTRETSPGAIPHLAGIEEVSAKEETVLALDEHGVVHAWGRNDSGQLGLGHMDDVTSPTPVAIPTSSPVEHVAMGDGISFVVAGGELFSTGSNEYGGLGTGRVLFRTTPEPVEGIPLIPVD